MCMLYFYFHQRKIFIPNFDVLGKMISYQNTSTEIKTLKKQQMTLLNPSSFYIKKRYSPFSATKIWNL